MASIRCYPPPLPLTQICHLQRDCTSLFLLPLSKTSLMNPFTFMYNFKGHVPWQYSLRSDVVAYGTGLLQVSISASNYTVTGLIESACHKHL